MQPQIANTLFIFVTTLLPFLFLGAGAWFVIKNKEVMKRVVGGLVTFGIIMAFYNSFSAGGPVITVDAPRATTPTQKREIPETKPLIESPTMDDYRNKFKEYEQEQDQRIEKSK